MTQQTAFGSWQSPISAQAVASAGRKFGQIIAEGSDLYWLEGRPEEAGRTTIVRLRGGQMSDCVDAPMSVRSSVHEYGGGAFAVNDGTLYFVNAEDQAIYRRPDRGKPDPLTPAHTGCSYADLQIDPHHNQLIAVCEHATAMDEPQASVVAIDTHGTVTTLASGHDFYASPRLSPDGTQLVWLAWNHPNMPWDGTQLWSATLDANGLAGEPKQLAGGDAESLFAPVFAPDGTLHVVSDVTGWWNIHRVTASGLDPVTREQAEFGLPQWVFGQSTYAFDATGHLYALFTAGGMWQMARVNRDNGALAIYDLPFTHLDQLIIAGDRLVFIGGSATTPPTLSSLHTDGADLRALRASADLAGWDEAALSAPHALTFDTADNEQAHALFYPPCNPGFRGPDGDKPPLLIKCHGGPTGATSTALDPRIQFWTSRGFAVLDVNYRGSTGYGRAYRQALYGKWGVADVADCMHGARYLASQGLIDPDRVVISGSSAGGYTVLCVLTFTNLCAAGASYYGIGDLSGLLATTHKFESRYLENLIGDDPQLLEQRSPLQHAEQLDCPVLFLQGLKDKVVPPEQAQSMADAVRRRGLPVALVTFANERHGFRAADNITTALQSELAFYARVLGFDPADTLPELTIANTG